MPSAESALTAVEDLQVLEDRVREFDACLPALAIAEIELGLPKSR